MKLKKFISQFLCVECETRVDLINAINDIEIEIDKEKIARLLYRKIYKILGFRIVPMGNNIKNIDKKYYKIVNNIKDVIKVVKK